MQRPCDFCGEQYEAKTDRSRFCKPDHRSQFGKAKKAGRPVPVATQQTAAALPPRTEVRDRLEREFRKIGVFDQYEAAAALYLAEELDLRTTTGTARVSMSKELDRRVDALRLKADRPDDPTRVIRERVEEKQAHLHAVG